MSQGETPNSFGFVFKLEDPKEIERGNADMETYVTVEVNEVIPRPLEATSNNVIMNFVTWNYRRTSNKGFTSQI